MVTISYGFVNRGKWVSPRLPVAAPGSKRGLFGAPHPDQRRLLIPVRSELVAVIEAWSYDGVRDPE